MVSVHKGGRPAETGQRESVREGHRCAVRADLDAGRIGGERQRPAGRGLRDVGQRGASGRVCPLDRDP